MPHIEMETKIEDEYALVFHQQWLNNAQTKTFLHNLTEQRNKLLAQAEEFAASPGTNDNLVHMHNLLLMSRRTKEILEYAQKIQSIIRS